MSVQIFQQQINKYYILNHISLSLHYKRCYKIYFCGLTSIHTRKIHDTLYLSKDMMKEDICSSKYGKSFVIFTRESFIIVIYEIFLK